MLLPAFTDAHVHLGLADPRALLPAGTTFVEVDGGVHAYFADYGEQPGDGQPTVGRAQARAVIGRADLDLMDRVAGTDGPAG